MGKNNQFYQRDYKAHGMNGSSLSKENVERMTRGYALDQSIIDNYLTNHRRVNEDEHCRDITMEYNTRHLDDKLTTFRVNDILTQEGISVARTGRNFYRYDSDAGMVRSLSRDSVLDLIGEAYSSDNPVPVASSGDDGGYRFTVGHFIRTLAASITLLGVLGVGTSCRSLNGGGYDTRASVVGRVYSVGNSLFAGDDAAHVTDLPVHVGEGAAADSAKSIKIPPPGAGVNINGGRSSIELLDGSFLNPVNGFKYNPDGSTEEYVCGPVKTSDSDSNTTVNDNNGGNPETIDDNVGDTTAPTFTHKPYDIKSNSVTIPVTLDEGATLVLKYGTDKSDLSNTQEYDLVSGSNSITLDGLVAGTPYFTNMIFTDISGNSRDYSDSFLTANETSGDSNDNGVSVPDTSSDFDVEPTVTLDGNYVTFNLDFKLAASVKVGYSINDGSDDVVSPAFPIGHDSVLVRNTGVEPGSYDITLSYHNYGQGEDFQTGAWLDEQVPDTNSKYDQPSPVGSFFRDLNKFPGGRPRTDTNDVNRSGWDNIRLRLGYTWNYGVKANFRNFLRTQFGLEGGADQVVKSYDGESNVGYGKRTGKSVPRGLGGIVGNLPLVGHAVDIAQGDSLEDTFLNPDENYTARAVRGTYSGGKAVVQTTTNVINKVAVQPVSAVVQGVGKLASYIPGLRGLRNKCKPVDALKKSVFGDVYQAGGHLVNAVRGNNGSRLGELRSARMEATSMLTGDPDGNDYHLPYVGTNGSPLGEAFSGVSGVVKPLKDVVNNIVLPEFGAVMSLSMAGGNGGQLVSDATFGNFCPTYRLSDFLFDDVLQGVATAVDPSQLTEGLDMGNGFTDNLDLTSAPLAYPLFHPQSERARGRMNGGWELINTGDHGIESANDPNEGATFLGGLLDVGRDIGAGFIIEDNLPKHEREPSDSTLTEIQ